MALMFGGSDPYPAPSTSTTVGFSKKCVRPVGLRWHMFQLGIRSKSLGVGRWRRGKRWVGLFEQVPRVP